MSELNISPLLKHTARTAHIFTHLQPGDLISIRKLFYDNCTTTLTATKINVVNNGLIILEIHRPVTYVIWKLNLTIIPCNQPSSPIPASLNSLKTITHPYLAQWYHATLFLPVLQIPLQAINKLYFATCTNLTVGLMKYLPSSMDATKGHMKQTSNNTQSTIALYPT